eukprot:scaffold92045_cov29-Tisochrysis_lutea.AAC.1
MEGWDQMNASRLPAQLRRQVLVAAGVRLAPTVGCLGWVDGGSAHAKWQSTSVTNRLPGGELELAGLSILESGE